MVFNSDVTEVNWNAGVDCRDLLFAFREEIESWNNDKCSRLLACEACRLVWNQLTDIRSHNAIEIAEQYCDGKATLKALTDAHKAATIAYNEAKRTPSHSASMAVSKATRPKNPTIGMFDAILAISVTGHEPWHEQLMMTFRDAFGPRLFRKVMFPVRWKTESVVRLAECMYETRNYTLMPILADALMEADCTNEELIKHCRDGGLHSRACWVLDLILTTDEVKKKKK